MLTWSNVFKDQAIYLVRIKNLNEYVSTLYVYGTLYSRALIICILPYHTFCFCAYNCNRICKTGHNSAIETPILKHYKTWFK